MKCPHCHKDTEVSPEALEKLNYAKGDAFLFRCKQETWFFDFWQLYPRKVAKASALKAWKKAATSEAIKDEIMAGLNAQLKEFMRRGSEFIPHASTYLNGRRWEDEASLGSLSKNDKPRIIACELCGDSGLVTAGLGIDEFRRCSCARGKLPGLYIPSEAQDAS